LTTIPIVIGPAVTLRELFVLLSQQFGDAPAPMPEEQLLRVVAAARDGDRVAAQHLYQQLVHRVYRTVRPMFAHAADAEDATQDALLTVLTSLDRYRPRDGARFEVWAMTVARNAARRRFRRRRPELTDTGELPETGAFEDLDAGLDLARRRRALLTALGELEARDREVVVLRYGAELTANEVGDALGLSPANVRKICERQRAALGARLEELLK
jgi:RNA polymerase sigma-70 factor (ECF subfamily)